MKHFGLLSPSVRYVSNSADKAIKKMVNSRSMNVPAVSKFLPQFQTIVSFLKKGKRLHLLNEALHVLEMKQNSLNDIMPYSNELFSNSSCSVGKVTFTNMWQARIIILVLRSIFHACICWKVSLERLPSISLFSYVLVDFLFFWIISDYLIPQFPWRDSSEGFTTNLEGFTFTRSKLSIAFFIDGQTTAVFYSVNFPSYSSNLV